MNRTVRIDLAYDGAGFHGWQVQPGLRTVQGTLARRLARLLGREHVPPGAGRTDAGVHALGQVCHVDGLNEAEGARLIRVLPGLVPDDIEIRAVRAVSPAFHARFSAVWRRYEYRLELRRDLFGRGRAWTPGRPLDRAAMDEAAAHFVGRRDCSSLCKTASLHETNDCDVQECRFAWHGDSAILHVRADRFLHHMVRTMAGTLVDVGRGLRRPDEVPALLDARDRRAAGPMAPAHGLYLAEVGYPDVLDDPAYVPADAVDPANPTKERT
jgi:tRNA pseudouridine38-40 synthase